MYRIKGPGTAQFSPVLKIKKENLKRQSTQLIIMIMVIIIIVAMYSFHIHLCEKES